MADAQETCVHVAVSGHNFVVCGQAGTGKSFILKRIASRLRETGTCVTTTATTGIACQQLPGSMTIHRWAGLQDGRLSTDELVDRITNEDSMQQTYLRIKKTQMLIIDEISMFSSKLMTQLETLLRSVRGGDRAFGGMQVILGGDFYQLPPVKNALYDDDGEYCFRSAIWETAFSHVIKLTKVYRQEEGKLVKAINEVARGEVSDNTIDFLRSLARPLEVQHCSEITHIFGTNIEVDIRNMDQIAQMEGEVNSFVAKDCGDLSYLRTSLAPPVLHVKRLCRVMLLTNLSDKLVNGSLGRVVDFGSIGPIVEFTETGITMEIKPVTFTVYNPREGRNMAERKQVPLKVAYALTCHKAQGSTLNAVKVDCHRLNRPGQLGVAIGRARTSEGLQVVDFRASCCVRQPVAVEEFYANAAVGEMREDLSCCQRLSSKIFDQHFSVPPLLECVDEYECEKAFAEEPDLDQAQLMLVDQAIEGALVEEEEVNLPESFDVQQLIDKAAMGGPVTDFISSVNDILQHLLQIEQHKLKVFVGRQLDVISSIWKENLNRGKVEQKHETAAYAAYHKHTTSVEYQGYCKTMFGTSNISEEQWTATFNICTAIREWCVEKTAEEITKCMPRIHVSRRLPSSNLTSGGRAKIRHVGGYVLGTIRYRHQEAARRQVYNLNADSRQKLHQHEAKIKLLSAGCRTEAQIVTESADPESLKETTRRQNVRESLTHVTDIAFNFFMMLTEEAVKLQSDENLCEQGQDINQFVINEILTNESVYTAFQSIYDNQSVQFSELIKGQSALIRETFEEVVILFSHVLLKQLRLDFLAEIKKKKKLAHRKQVLQASTGTSSSTDTTTATASRLSYQILLDDESENKSVAHEQLKSYAEVNDKLPNMTKGQLQNVCRAYSVEQGGKDTKAILENKLVNEIKKRNFMSEPHHLSAPGASVPKRRGLKRKASDINKCKICRQVEDPENDSGWVQCDRCKKWFHRECAEILDDDEWNQYTKSNKEFICHLC